MDTTGPAFQMSSVVRREESNLTLVGLRNELSDWLQSRRDADSHDVHHAQLLAVKRVIADAARELGCGIQRISVSGEPPDIYEACRLADIRTLWLRRVWDFSRAKFDQRDNPTARATLEAADEVVWSCYHAVFERAKYEVDGIVERPLPLPFFESRYVPEAQPSELVPRDLKEDLGFVRECLERMPLSVVRIPPTCMRAPWWLALLAHETGHHVQRDLLAEGALETAFGEHVRTAVENCAACADGDGQRWSAWSRELFADVFSICAIGTAAATAIAQLQFRAAGKMVQAKYDYPPAVLRLAVMAETASVLGLEAPQLPAGIDPVRLAEDDAVTRHQLELVSAVVEAALAPLPGLGAAGLAELCDLQLDDFAFGGIVPEAAAALRGRPGEPAAPSLRAPRMVAAASMLAWTEIGGLPSAEQRRAERDAVAGAMVGAIFACREGTKRERGAEVAGTPEAGRTLASTLLEADLQTLEAL